MEIFVEVMTLYGITLVVSMSVAAIIWAMAKLIDLLPGEDTKPNLF